MFPLFRREANRLRLVLRRVTPAYVARIILAMSCLRLHTSGLLRGRRVFGSRSIGLVRFLDSRVFRRQLIDEGFLRSFYQLNCFFKANF